MPYKYKKSEPRWINFENPTGEKGKAAIENHGAKGHAFERFCDGEVKTLCNFQGSGFVRRIWITLSQRTPEILQGVTLKMYWDNSEAPQVDVPLGDFFCMGLGIMRPFENHFFSTAEGRSFSCFIPMPFRKSCRITLTNNSGILIKSLYYDINLTLEEVDEDDMYFYAKFNNIELNEIEKDATILPYTKGSGRFLGANISVFPNEEWYGDLWWGEGEVKIYIDGDDKYPTLAGTGAEDYVGSAWMLGEFCNDSNGCVSKDENRVSMYRFHINDPIFFHNDIRVGIQVMGGGRVEKVKKAIKSGYPCVPVTDNENGEFRHIYKKKIADLRSDVQFFRCDKYRMVAYYYMK